MPGVSPHALAGYILEEMLAYLLRNAGYRLLTDESQDPQELANRHHGLVVKGRGGEHQADVLGELLWIPAFTFPIRLVLEAKCRKGRTDIAAVRGMVAALLDINQNNMPNRRTTRNSIPRAKYSYVGSIFSASGFSKQAADFALAHAVSLVDLRAAEFQSLVNAARRCGADLSTWYKALEQRSASGFVRAVRDSLRMAFQTAVPAQVSMIPTAISQNQLALAVTAAEQTQELFIGMASGPYMLALKADDPHLFLQFARASPTHDVEIHWSRGLDEGRTWTITPLGAPASYQLFFKLPDRLADWIFNAENVRRTALLAKEAFLSSITIYRKDGMRDQLIRLTYNPRYIRGRESQPG